MEKEYEELVQQIIPEINPEIFETIKNQNLEIKEDNSNSKELFEPEEIGKQLKLMKNKSVSNFDKIHFYKNQTIQKSNPNYLKFREFLSEIFQKWITQPTQKEIEFIKKRNIIFIHKGGPEGNTKNYRPISINQAIPRIFLKILYSKIENCWDYIDKKQYGFRRKLGTTIAVLNFKKEYDNYLNQILNSIKKPKIQMKNSNKKEKLNVPKNLIKNFDPVISDHIFSEKIIDYSKNLDEENPSILTPNKSNFSEKNSSQNLKFPKNPKKNSKKIQKTIKKILIHKDQKKSIKKILIK